MLISALNPYGAIIGSGMILCIVLAFFMAKKRGYDTDNVFTVALVCIPLAILMARTYYVVTDVIAGKSWTIGQFFGFSTSGEFVGFAGLAIYGGLLGGILGAVIVRLFNKRKPIEKQMTFMQMADMYFCLIILGQAIGRWGNFANGEAYGQLITNPAWQWWPFAVEVDGNYYHATYFYESMWNLIGFGLLQWFYNGKRKSFDGFYFSFYCMWYGFIRFWIEILRSDSMYFGSIKANQLISAIIFLLGLGILIYHIVMAKRAGKKPFLFVKEEEIGPEYYGYEKSFFYVKTLFPAKNSKAAKQDEPIQDDAAVVENVAIEAADGGEQNAEQEIIEGEAEATPNSENADEA